MLEEQAGYKPRRLSSRPLCAKKLGVSCRV
jgi:hypothetical protein